MIRLLATAVIALLSNALALIVGAQVLDDMSLSVSGFITAVLLFTGVQMLAEPFLRQLAFRNSSVLLGSSALIATLVSVVVTAAVSDGLSVTGTTTWVLAAVLIWAVALAGRLLLPLVLFKKILADQRSGG